ncbi:hypothetical protein AS29_011210 [Bacillus sp. SJS]|nr:hypothetical protein AS29_011210 [Bacillus sp. SJS]
MRRAGQKAGSFLLGVRLVLKWGMLKVGVLNCVDAESGPVPRCFTAKGDRDLYQEGLMGQRFASEVPEL